MYSNFKEHLAKELQDIRDAGLYKEERVIVTPQSADIAVEGRKGDVLNFCANNYLGLADNSRLIEAAKKAMDERGYGMSSVRFPGLISYVTPPGGGTTDYAVDIYYAAVQGRTFKCPIKAGTFMDMMYMPDALRAAIEIMEADPSRLKHRNSFNIASMSFDPEIIYNKIKEYKPEFVMEYEPDPLRQAIADSWPDRLDDSCARAEWDWKPEYDLDAMTRDMLEKLELKFAPKLELH